MDRSSGYSANAPNFGDHIRDLRRMRGWSQELLAAEAGLNVNYLGRIERGERNPSLKSLAKIANALDLTVPDLVEPIGHHLISVSSIQTPSEVAQARQPGD